jgi:hypothetical protein
MASPADARIGSMPFADRAAGTGNTGSVTAGNDGDVEAVAGEVGADRVCGPANCRRRKRINPMSQNQQIDSALHYYGISLMRDYLTGIAAMPASFCGRHGGFVDGGVILPRSAV